MDVLDIKSVPAFVADQILSLRDFVGDRHAALTRINDERRLSWSAREKAESSLAELKRRYGKFLDITKPPASQLDEEIARHAAVVRRCDARSAELSTMWQGADRLRIALEDYVKENASALVPFEGPTPQLLDGETALVGLERVARRVRSLQADRIAILAAPFPSALAKKRVKAQLEALAAGARPDVADILDRLGEAKFATVPLQTFGDSGNHVGVNSIDVLGLLSWLFPKEFEARLAKEIDGQAEDDVALDPAQRSARLAVVDADLLTSEREEAAFAELAGQFPRADIDPRAALKLADSAPAPRRD
ncbi:hypothetical protein [Bradyrhizobium sp. CCBAU 53415]|uniref:hypothetical protein n=1 Tax=Bradyrhizobium sp. CCBAU 53415 TaxID=1325119 RepID=UPI002306D704|nr:hypothetical protein [Bradyrhizobium sp. CCBAU 53415]MDA9465336.1 hypothetical protein [Bradyrhizobium sp. CCBAU 53415]